MTARHHDAHDATHPRWGFRAESAIWIEGRAEAPNMATYAHELARWLRREQRHIKLCPEEHRGTVGAFTNPYTYDASTHFALISSAVDAAVEFVEGTDDLAPFEAETRRLRLYNELVMESTRFCEAAIKQMLYCTNVPHRLYKNWSLGQLMAADCEDCRKDSRPTRTPCLVRSHASTTSVRCSRRAASTTSPWSTAGETQRLPMQARPA